MKPRVLKKLCKKAYQLSGDRYGVPFVTDDEDEWCTIAYGYFPRPITAQEQRTQEHYRNRMSGFLVVGAGLDYYGEYYEGRDLFTAAQEDMLWAFGEQRMAVDEFGDEHIDWPDYPKRLTGKEVIRLLRLPYPTTGEDSDE